jgi:3-hydroxyisobutyrate dehydrogenase-like beta-hydroxyacid dehydrogenase
MADGAIGLLHPGEMGAAIGAALVADGRRVAWASEGRSAETRRRAEEAGLDDAATVAELVRRSDVILSVCPPHAAGDVARSVSGFEGLYVDANAIAPATLRGLAGAVPGAELVDGGIVGPPPHRTGTTRLYLSGPAAPEVAELFAGTRVDARVVSGETGAASALKVAYAAWSKGTAAMLLAIAELARAEGVEQSLLEEWRLSIPELEERRRSAERSAQAKGWRWVGEMEEIAAAFAADGLPAGFHLAAAEVFRTFSTEEAPGWRHAVGS